MTEMKKGSSYEDDKDQVFRDEVWNVILALITIFIIGGICFIFR